MWPESPERPQPLRTGLTTGCCATACCVAAARALLDRRHQSAGTAALPKVSVKLPKGKTVELSLCELVANEDYAMAATIKDAGDDPDVTHGARVFVELRLTAQAGVFFKAAQGVGTVTREGLLLAVGEPAINPVPRTMMRDHLEQLGEEYSYSGGFEVSVGVTGGEALALKTMNPRLGIVGGLSILGTTGIVRPFSCAAYIASIHQGIDVARANGVNHIAAATGNSSEAAIRAHYQLPEMAVIEMGDFVGALLKYLKRVRIPKVSLCGGFGKISKLANGHLDLHSRASAIDFHHLAQLARIRGASEALTQRIQACNTSVEALGYCQDSGVDLAAAVCDAALVQARKRVPQDIELDVWVVDRQGRLIGSAADRAGL